MMCSGRETNESTENAISHIFLDITPYLLVISLDNAYKLESVNHLMAIS